VTAIAALLAAEARAEALLAACRPLIRAGQSERELTDAVYALGHERFGTRRYWHKRIVRAGENTLLPYAANPPDHVLAADDIMFFDLGPVFDDWEADVGRSHVLGDDPHRHRLAADSAALWHEVRAWAQGRPELTAAQLYRHLEGQARARGWELGHIHCGHLIGRFPHEQLLGDDASMYLRADNPLRLDALDAHGERYQWILEVHLVDRARRIGAFHESVLVR
jgi:Xaa-Pro aminopeptidase